jgi:3D (Asp-Asp-Asp) domain-containing protein
VAATPEVTAWVQNETLHSCNWTPSSNKKPAGFGYTTSQTSTSCSKDKTRSVQAREYNAQTDQYRNVSSPTTETSTEIVASVDSTVIPSTGILGSKVCRYLHPQTMSSFYWETVNTGGVYMENVVWGF